MANIGDIRERLSKAAMSAEGEMRILLTDALAELKALDSHIDSLQKPIGLTYDRWKNDVVKRIEQVATAPWSSNEGHQRTASVAPHIIYISRS